MTSFSKKTIKLMCYFTFSTCFHFESQAGNDQAYVYCANKKKIGGGLKINQLSYQDLGK